MDRQMQVPAHQYCGHWHIGVPIRRLDPKEHHRCHRTVGDWMDGWNGRGMKDGAGGAKAWCSS